MSRLQYLHIQPSVVVYHVERRTHIPEEDFEFWAIDFAVGHLSVLLQLSIRIQATVIFVLEMNGFPQISPHILCAGIAGWYDFHPTLRIKEEVLVHKVVRTPHLETLQI